MSDLWWLVAFVFASSLLLTGVVRAMAHDLGMIDRPNIRSSHSNPTPRGGGLAIVVAFAAGLVVLLALGVVDRGLGLALLGGGLPLALIGFMDDRRSLPASVRFACHIGAGSWAIYALGGLPPVEIGSYVVRLGFFGDVLAVVAVIWALNLFNFMDGVDGIAASEAIFVCWSGACLTLMLDGGSAVPSVALLVGAACCGFLIWNWPPAKIFMGDVGSGFLGFVIAVLATAAARESSAALVVWMILGAVFFADATTTLLRRLFRGERPHQAHRSHAYQRLARQWGSHRRITLVILAVNVFILLPCALVVVVYTNLAWWVLLFVLLSIGTLVLKAGAGRP